MFEFSDLFYENRDIKHKIIILSGGKDSTYCLLKEIEKMKEKEVPKDDHGLSAIYFEHFNIYSKKRKMELRAIRKILKKIEKEFGYTINLSIIKTDIQSDYNFVNAKQDSELINSGWFSAQSTLWNAMLLQIICNIYVKDVEIIIGENADDSFATEIARETKEMVETSVKRLRAEEKNLNIKVSFPILFCHSTEIMEYLIDNYPDYYKLCWFCEMPIKDEKSKNLYKPCCKCSKCLDHIKNLYAVRLRKEATMDIIHEEAVLNPEKFVRKADEKKYLKKKISREKIKIKKEEKENE